MIILVVIKFLLNLIKLLKINRKQDLKIFEKLKISLDKKEIIIIYIY